MSLSDKFQERLDAAVKRFQLENKVAETVSPAEQISIFLRVADYLESPSDKMAFSYLLYNMAQTDDQKENILNWTKKYSQKKNGQAFSDIAIDSIFFTDFAEFAAQVSKDEYQTLINAHPLAYAENFRDLERRGLDTSIRPTPEALENSIRKLPPSEWDVKYLPYLQDEALKRQMIKTLAEDPLKSSRFLYEPNTAELRKIPEGNYLLKQIFARSERLNFPDTGPLEPGTVKANMMFSLGSARRLGLEDYALSRLEMGSRLDPAFALRQAITKYPEDSSGLKDYANALPRASELFSNPNHASLIVRMLNKLEPSQYAGMNVKLIPEKEVFRLLDKASSGQLYDLITQQQDAMSYAYTQGTYNEISKRLYQQIKAEGTSLTAVMNSTPERQQKIVSFVQTADSFRRLDDMMAHSTPDDHMTFIDKLFDPKNESYNISTISHLIKEFPKGSPLLPVIEATIIDRAIKGNDYVKADMGILSHWYAGNGKHVPTADNKKFFDTVRADPSFEIKPLEKIPASTFLDGGNRNFQLHVFYNDSDGIDTYKSFSAALKNDGWQSKKQNDFLIYSKERDGRRIEILVSPPEANGEVVAKIKEYVQQKNGTISMLFGRGHAHHMEEAVKLVDDKMRVISLGGCWGHNYASTVLDSSPEAHILATTGVGRMVINNFNTRWINNQVLSGQDIDWRKLRAEWDKLATDRTIAADLRDYIAPDENTILLYEKKRNELYKKIEEIENAPKPQSSLQQDFMRSVRQQTASGPSQNSLLEANLAQPKTTLAANI